MVLRSCFSTQVRPSSFQRVSLFFNTLFASLPVGLIWLESLLLVILHMTKRGCHHEKKSIRPSAVCLSVEPYAFLYSKKLLMENRKQKYLRFTLFIPTAHRESLFVQLSCRLAMTSSTVYYHIWSIKAFSLQRINIVFILLQVFFLVSTDER